jgi:hypothetical protein
MNNYHKTLDPNYASGLIDGEGTFVINIIKDTGFKTG